MKRKKPSFLRKPAFVVKIEEKILAFLDWIAPVVDWVEDQAEKYKAASDAVPPPSKRWVHKRHINTGKATVTLFLLFLTVMTVLALYLPNRPTWSELEHRNLTKFPKPTVVSVLNGQFFDGINTWFADTFPMREKFLGAHSKIKSYYGFRSDLIVGDVEAADDIPDPVKPPAPREEDSSGDESASSAAGEASSVEPAAEEPDQKEQDKKDEEITDADVKTLGALLVIKNAAYEYYNFVQDTADQYVSVINRAAEQLEGKAKVYDMVVPTSMDICVPQKVRKKINTSDQESALNYLYSSMTEQVGTVNLMETMRNHQEAEEYLYFRTDHHWTALGAYYAYVEFTKAAGKEAVPLEDYQESVFEGFTGSFYRETESAAMAEKPDTVYAYAPKSTNSMEITLADGGQLTHDIIGDGNELSASMKYLSFIGGDNPISVIENPDINDSSAIMVIKDSFGNCFAPFLVENYQYVYVVDFRNIEDVESRKLAELVQDYQIDDVLILHSISSTRASDDINSMANFVG